MPVADRCKLFLGPPAFILAFGIYKSLSIAHAISSDSSRYFPYFLQPDLAITGLLGLLAVGQSLARHLLLKFLLWLFIAAITLFYFADSIVLLMFDQHYLFADVVKYWKVWSSYPVLPGWTECAGVGLLLLALSVPASGSLQARAFAGTLSGLLLALGLLPIPGAPRSELYAKYLQTPGVEWFSAHSRILGPAIYQRYSQETTAAAAAEFPATHRLLVPSSKPNVILLVMESLTSAYSKRTSGLEDFLPVFDAIAKQGKLFPNFFANYSASDGGLISLLSGVPPLLYPGALREEFIEFAHTPSVVSQFRDLGYATVAISGYPARAFELGTYLNGVGFEAVLSRENVPRLESAPKLVLGAAPDFYLYEEVKSHFPVLKQMGKPYFYTIITASTHTGGDRGFSSRWAEAQFLLLTFINQLRESNFFENGILLITGDHHAMETIDEPEMLRYGDSSRARVPLLAIGKGIPQDSIDTRYFQQTDLFWKLTEIAESSSELSPNPVWIERYNWLQGESSAAGKFGVYSSQDGGQKMLRGEVIGKDLRWLETAPLDARKIEHEIHTQRAFYQQLRERREGDCVIPTNIGTPTSRNGLLMSVFDGVDLTLPMVKRAVNYLGERVVPEVYFPDAPSMQSLKKELFSLRLSGYIEIPEDGTYTVIVRSDDGVCLTINRKTLIDHDMGHWGDPIYATVNLTKGFYPLDLRYYQSYGGAQLTFSWVLPNHSEEGIVPTKYLFLAAADDTPLP